MRGRRGEEAGYCFGYFIEKGFQGIRGLVHIVENNFTHNFIIQMPICKTRRKSLYFETVGSSATTSTFEFASLGDDSWLDTIVGVRIVRGSSVTEVFGGFTNTLAST